MGRRIGSTDLASHTDTGSVFGLALKLPPITPQPTSHPPSNPAAVARSPSCRSRGVSRMTVEKSVWEDPDWGSDGGVVVSHSS